MGLSAIRDLAPLDEDVIDAMPSRNRGGKRLKVPFQFEPGSMDWTRSQSQEKNDRSQSMKSKKKERKNKKNKRAKSMKKKSKKSQKVPRGIVNENSWHRSRMSHKKGHH